MTRADLYNFIDSVRTEFGISETDIPFDCVNFVYERFNDIVIEYKVFESACFHGALFKGKRSLMVLNSKRGKLQQNFDCAHELIHYLYDSSGETAVFKGLIPEDDPFCEWRANEGAAELLVPRRVIVPIAAGETIDNYDGSLSDAINDINLIFNLSELFSVTEAVIINRLRTLGGEINLLMTDYTSKLQNNNITALLT